MTTVIDAALADFDVGLCRDAKRQFAERTANGLRRSRSLRTPGGTRTPNLLIRNQTLYPIELRVRVWPYGSGVSGTGKPGMGQQTALSENS